MHPQKGSWKGHESRRKRRSLRLEFLVSGLDVCFEGRVEDPKLLGRKGRVRRGRHGCRPDHSCYPPVDPGVGDHVEDAEETRVKGRGIPLYRSQFWDLDPRTVGTTVRYYRLQSDPPPSGSASPGASVTVVEGRYPLYT